MSQYPSNRSGRSPEGYTRSAASAQPGISRSNRSGGYGARPAGQRSASGQRSAAGQRPGYGARPSGQRGYSGGRPQQRPVNGGARRPSSPNGGRRPPRRKPKGRFFALLAVVLAALVALIVVVVKPGGGDAPVTPATTVAANVSAPVETAVVPGTEGTGTGTGDAGQNTSGQSTYASIAEQLAGEGNSVQGLSADQMVQVADLSINQSLPQEWLNVLLLGTDERTLTESARTDAIIICSINTTTGQVKLTNIMRDLDVHFSDIGQYNGNYGINAANYFGGPKLAIKTVNELFDMNIQYYVMVNFFGFQKIAERLGGVDVSVSQQEMELINERIVEQYKFAVLAGVDESDLENKKLETYGENTHLDGRQTLAYARLRKTDGGDYRRVERQQTVLTKLMEKAKGLNWLQVVQLANDMMPWVQTNMDFEEMLKVAGTVLNTGISNVETFRLPVQGTYKEESRKERSALYDCDFDSNAIKLYDFIYE